VHDLAICAISKFCRTVRAQFVNFVPKVDLNPNPNYDCDLTLILRCAHLQIVQRDFEITQIDKYSHK